MVTLYKIDQAILDCIDTETGEILDIDKLESLQIDREKKIEHCGLWYLEMVADEEKISNEIKRLSERKESINKQAKRLKGYIAFALGGRTLETPILSAKWRKSSAVEIMDNERFVKQHQLLGRDDLLSYLELKPNKTAIKQAINDGQTILYADIVENNNLVIK